MSSAPLRLLAASLIVSALAGCQKGPRVETTVVERPGEVIVVQTIQMQATVLAVDATRSTLTLKPKRGDAKTFKVTPGAVDLRQVRVGDEVHAVLVEETAVVLVSGGAPESVGVAAAVALAPEGEKPGVVMATTVEVTATVVAIDGHEHTVTLEFPDGRIEELNVGRHRDLTKVALGDSVRIQMTEALAIAIVKPQD